MKYKRILISFIGVVFFGIIALGPWDAYYRSELRGDYTESVYVGNFPVWMGSMLGLDRQRETIEKRINHHNEQIAEYENEASEPQANHIEIERKISVQKEKKRGLLDFLFGR